MKAKKLIVIAVAALSLITLTACSSTSNSQLKQIQSKGKLVVALSADFSPFEFQMLQNGKNTIVGSDVDLANEIGKELGVKVEFSNMDFNSVLTSVSNGKADIAISGIDDTPLREKTFDFTDSYYKDGNLIVVKKADVNKYTTLASFDGKQVAAQKASIQEGILTSQLPKATEVPLPATTNAVIELQSGKIAGTVLDEIVAKQYVDENSNLAIAPVTLKRPAGAGMAIALPKGSTELKNKLNSIISKLKASRWIRQTIDKNIKLSTQAASSK